MKPCDAARTLGRRGGRARAAKLSPDARRAIASRGGKARSLSFHAARRIQENFEYLAAADTLRGRNGKVTRTRSFTGSLPGTGLRADPNAGSLDPSRNRR